MKIFPSSSIKKLDAYTIEHEPIASIDLMERAATALTKAIMNRWSRETPVTVFAGPGNNGGDALAVARMLSEKGYKTEVYLFNPKGELSPDCQIRKCLIHDDNDVGQILCVGFCCFRFVFRQRLFCFIRIVSCRTLHCHIGKIHGKGHCHAVYFCHICRCEQKRIQIMSETIPAAGH